MKISALAPWFGSKRTLAPRIVEALGKHRCYWEPFCGSCAVLFSKKRCTYETVNDLHTDLINLALVVQGEKTALDLYGRVNRCLFHEALLPIAKAFLIGREIEPGTPDVERAYWYIVFSWMGLNGVSGTPLSHTGTFAVRYSANGGNGATRWESVCESLPEWHRRLVGVQILNRDAITVLERLDDAEGTAVYIDPPYFTKGAKYVHDFAADDHARLAAAIKRFERCRIVVSYYDHPKLEELYPDWQKIDCALVKSMINPGRNKGEGTTVAPEVLLVNGHAERMLF
jgi:DNA adenine methylase